MSGHLLISTARAVSRIQTRCLHISPVCLGQVTLTQEQKDKIHPIIGNRDIVGFGHSGDADYMDRNDFPCPAVRWKPNTSDVIALREKEKADWKNLSMEEKKALYRASFRQTFAELNAPTGDWKFYVAAVVMSFVATFWIAIWLEKFVYPPLPSTITDEYKDYCVERMIKQGQGPVTGISSMYDFEKKQWK